MTSPPSSPTSASVRPRLTKSNTMFRVQSDGASSTAGDSDADIGLLHYARSFRSAYALAGVDTDWAATTPTPATIAMVHRMMGAGNADSRPGSAWLSRSPPTAGGRPRGGNPAGEACSPGGGRGGLSGTPIGRWWLEECAGGQSGSEGLFEVVTGVVPLRASPRAEAGSVGALRAGTRFCGIPEQIKGSAWIRLRSHGALPPVFIPGGAPPKPQRKTAPRRAMSMASRPRLTSGVTTDDDGASEASDAALLAKEHATGRLYRTATPVPLLRQSDLERLEEVWVQYNKQYIERLRDTNRERGFVSYSNLSSLSWLSMDRRAWRSAVAKHRVASPALMGSASTDTLSGDVAAVSSSLPPSSPTTVEVAPFASILGETLLEELGSERPTEKVLGSKTAVGLFFSASWCRSSKDQMPELSVAYRKALQGKGMEIVYVSSDTDEKMFKAYFGAQPWLALPYRKRDIKEALVMRFSASPTPKLIILDKHGKVITNEGLRVLSADPSGARYPWTLMGTDGQRSN